MAYLYFPALSPPGWHLLLVTAGMGRHRMLYPVFKNIGDFCLVFCFTALSCHSFDAGLFLALSLKEYKCRRPSS